MPARSGKSNECVYIYTHACHAFKDTTFMESCTPKALKEDLLQARYFFGCLFFCPFLSCEEWQAFRAEVLGEVMQLIQGLEPPAIVRAPRTNDVCLLGCC